ncbi:hypothetical protein ACQ143_08725 [Microbacterium sp. MC2]
MKDILIAGHRILTTDDVADAVIGYARALVSNGATDLVEFPTLYNGEAGRCTLLLGTGSLAVVDADMVLAPSLADADAACAEIDRRTKALPIPTISGPAGSAGAS